MKDDKMTTYPIFVMSCGHKLERKDTKRSRYDLKLGHTISGCFCKLCAVSSLEYKIWRCERCGIEFESPKKCNNVKYCPHCGKIVQRWQANNRDSHRIQVVKRVQIPEKERVDFLEVGDYPPGKFGIMIPVLWTITDIQDMRGVFTK